MRRSYKLFHKEELLSFLLSHLFYFSSSVASGETVEGMEDMMEDMELEHMHDDSAYDSFSSQGMDSTC